MKRIFTVKQLCKITGNQPDLFYGLIHSGELRAIDLSGPSAKRKRWGIDEHDWQKFLAKRATREPDSYVVDGPSRKTRTPKSLRAFV